MGFRFRKSIRLLPGVRLNLGMRGASISIGGRGLTTNVSARGTRTTVSLPGTGLSYSTYSSRGRGGAVALAPTATPTAARATSGATAPLPVSRWVVGIVLVLSALVVLPSSVALTCLGGGAVIWAFIRYRRRNPARREALARQWALVKSNPRDPMYATLLARWYGPDISDAERRANDVP